MTSGESWAADGRRVRSPLSSISREDPAFGSKSSAGAGEVWAPEMVVSARA